MKKSMSTTGTIKFIRPDGFGYAIPDKTFFAYVGQNVLFQTTEKLKIGDRVSMIFRPLDEKQLFAISIKKGKGK